MPESRVPRAGAIMSQVKTLSPKQAFQFLKEHPGALFVDVRANMEYLFVGHPAGAIHIPWIDEPDWKVNPHFVTQVRQAVLGGASGAAPVVLICRSGVRSLDAGKALIEAGFPEVYNIAEGFEGALDDHHHRSAVGGWRFHGLPWEQC
jgi:rhodanese-related sulfurtransferase